MPRFELTSDLFEKDCTNPSNTSYNWIRLEKTDDGLFLSLHLKIKTVEPSQDEDNDENVEAQLIALAACENNTRETQDARDYNYLMEQRCTVEIRKDDMTNQKGKSTLTITAAVDPKLPRTGEGESNFKETLTKRLKRFKIAQ